MEGVNRELKKIDGKFNDGKDFVDYRLSFYCEESRKRFQILFDKFVSDILQILDDDRLNEKNTAIQENE